MKMSQGTTWNGGQVGFIHWTLANAAAVNTVTNWAKKWLDPNGDGNTADGVIVRTTSTNAQGEYNFGGTSTAPQPITSFVQE